MCRCAKEPVPFKIGEHTIYGTGFGGMSTKYNQSQPGKVKGFDLVVLLDHFAGEDLLKKSKPWKSPKVFQFAIPDRSIPEDDEEFDKLLAYLEVALFQGKKVVIGCIGGHGRTGMVLAALYARMTGDDSGAKLVRSTYCQKAIESKEQIKYLTTRFHQAAVPPQKRPAPINPSGYQLFGRQFGGSDYGWQAELDQLDSTIPRRSPGPRQPSGSKTAISLPAKHSKLFDTTL